MSASPDCFGQQGQQAVDQMDLRVRVRVAGGERARILERAAEVAAAHLRDDALEFRGPFGRVLDGGLQRGFVVLGRIGQLRNQVIHRGRGGGRGRVRGAHPGRRQQARGRGAQDTRQPGKSGGEAEGTGSGDVEVHEPGFTRESANRQAADAAGAEERGNCQEPAVLLTVEHDAQPIPPPSMVRRPLPRGWQSASCSRRLRPTPGARPRCAAAWWKVTDTAGHTLYLAGSVHALRPSDYPFPAPYEQAYAASSSLAFETDLTLGADQWRKAMGLAALYPMKRQNSRTTSIRAPTRTILRVIGNAHGSTEPEKRIEHFRPWAIAFMLESPGGLPGREHPVRRGTLLHPEGQA